MTNESFTLYKLIILYFLSKVDSTLPPGIISDYITDHGYTNYFNVQNAFAELLEAELIKEDTTYQLSYYQLTETGRETLVLFGNQLSAKIRIEIDEYLQEKQYEIIDETSLISDYQSTSQGTYMVTCLLRERNQTLFRTELEVTTEEDAIRACENWRKKSAKLYQATLSTLLSD